jgi:hypothetical protein
MTSPSNISDEAVEAAARALYKGQPIYDEAVGVITGYKPWDWMEPEYQNSMRSDARAALEAAAPHLMAAAWDEGVLIGFDEGQGVRGRTRNPYRAAGAGL